MACRICNTNDCVHLMGDQSGVEREMAEEISPEVDGRPARVARIKEDINKQITGLVSPEEKARLAIRLEATIGYVIAVELMGATKASQFLVEEVVERCLEAHLPKPDDDQLGIIVLEIRRLGSQLSLPKPGVP